MSYLSAEFLMGPQLGSHLIDLDIFDEMQEVTHDLGFNLKDIMNQESYHFV